MPSLGTPEDLLEGIRPDKGILVDVAFQHHSLASPEPSSALGICVMIKLISQWQEAVVVLISISSSTAFWLKLLLCRQSPYAALSYDVNKVEHIVSC